MGEDFYNSSHGFIVADQAFVNIKAHFPDSAKIGGLPEGEFRHKGYDGQKLYFRSDPNAQPIAPYGDTVRLGFPALYKEYYLSD